MEKQKFNWNLWGQVLPIVLGIVAIVAFSLLLFGCGGREPFFEPISKISQPCKSKKTHKKCVNKKCEKKCFKSKKCKRFISCKIVCKVQKTIVKCPKPPKPPKPPVIDCGDECEKPECDDCEKCECEECKCPPPQPPPPPLCNVEECQFPPGCVLPCEQGNDPILLECLESIQTEDFLPHCVEFFRDQLDPGCHIPPHCLEQHPPEEDFCGNGICGVGEDCNVCPGDCGHCIQPVETCGDGVCEGWECQYCPQDCKEKECEDPKWCGNGYCEEGLGEDCNTCSEDCGSCIGHCGDGLCSENETCQGCAEDCGKCPPSDYVPPQDPPQQEPNEDNGNEAVAGGCSVSNGNNGSLFCILLMLPFFFLSRKQIVFFLILFGFVFVCGVASAEGLPTQILYPANGTYDYIGTNDARVTLPKVSLFFQNENRPLRLIDKPTNDTIGSVIKNRSTLHALFNFNIGKRVELGLDIPIVLEQGDGKELGLFGYNSIGGGVSDIGLLLKLGLIDYKGFYFSFLGNIQMPTSGVELVGEREGAFIPKLVATYDFGKLDLTANVGFRLRFEEKYRPLPSIQEYAAGQQLVASLAGRLQLTDYLALISDIHLATTLEQVVEEEVPLEWLNGLVVRLPQGFGINAGVGAGLTRGVGTPVYRAFGGFTWSWDWREQEIKKECKKCSPIKTKVIKITQKIPPQKKIYVDRKIIIFPPVYFKFDKDVVEKQSQSTLEYVAESMKKHKWIKLVIINGHTDERGSRAYNQDLGKRRATNVFNFLVSSGINKGRLEFKTFGEETPLYPNAKNEGQHARNRRVEFKVLILK